jgi:hypothetical protein
LRLRAPDDVGSHFGSQDGTRKTVQARVAVATMRLPRETGNGPDVSVGSARNRVFPLATRMPRFTRVTRQIAMSPLSLS